MGSCTIIVTIGHIPSSSERRILWLVGPAIAREDLAPVSSHTTDSVAVADVVADGQLIRCVVVLHTRHRTGYDRAPLCATTWTGAR